MKSTEDVRKFAAEQGITEEAAVEKGLQQKATEFSEAGAEILRQDIMGSASRVTRGLRRLA
jgi:phosphomethylpyrimidine synthase